MTGTKTRSSALRDWAIWTVGFIAFPIGGVLGGTVAGPVDTLGAAAIGGLLTGLVIGAGQALAGRNMGLSAVRWVPATAVGMAVGLALGASAVGFRTGLTDLVLVGVLTGIPLGVAQALALPSHLRLRWLWAFTTPVLWGLGWAVTTLVGIDVERQYTIFGSTGAITVSALAGLVLFALTRRQP
jgi:hypothetical protein